MPTPSRRPASTPVRPIAPLQPRIERIPPASRRAVEQRFGLDLSDVPVRRGPESSAAAAALRARAFTVGGDIHLPDRAGPVGGVPMEALLAHELTHVAQRRRLGPELPGEGSPHGRALEEEARSAERGSSPLVAAGPDGIDAMAGAGRWPAPRAASAEPQSVHGPSTGWTAAGPDRDGPGGPHGPLFSSAHGLAGPAFRTIQRAPEGGSGPEGGGDAEHVLEELSGRLYERISNRLRGELLVDRERSGLLIDPRGR